MIFAKITNGSARLLGSVAALGILSGCPALAPTTPVGSPTPAPGATGAPGAPGATGAPGVDATAAPVASATPAPTGSTPSTATPTPGASSTPTPGASATPSPAGTLAPGQQAAVPMSTALNAYLVLAGQGITNTGPTTIGGDVGVSPAAMSTITGFGSVTFTDGGAIQSTPDAASAKNDLTTSYNDAAGRSDTPIILGSTINGPILPPGLYRTSAGAVVGPQDLTLDAKGDANAVFIFQIHDALTTAANSKVVLSGGAQAKNVFWQVGSSATLGANSVMKGNLIALTSITLGKNANLQGRALARNAAVTMDTNIITAP